MDDSQLVIELLSEFGAILSTVVCYARQPAVCSS